MKKIYFRKVKGGGMHILQVIFFGAVVTLSKNKSWSNGEVHGWRLSVKRRNQTAL